MFLLLPEELSVYILTFLTDIEDVLNISLVCKTLKRLAVEDVIWKKFYVQRYFSDQVSVSTLRQCSNLSWHFLFYNKSRIENKKWEVALPPNLTKSIYSSRPSNKLSKTNMIHSFERLPSSSPSTRPRSASASDIDTRSRNDESLTFSPYESQMTTSKSSPSIKDVNRENEGGALSDEESSPYSFTKWKRRSSSNSNHILIRNRVLEVTCMRFDERNVVTGGGFADVWDFDPSAILAPKTVQVYDIRTGRKAKTLTGHSDSITCVKIHGDTIISGSKDRTIRVWKRLGHKWSKRIGYESHTLFGHNKAVTCLHSDKNTLISGGKDKMIKIWDLTTRECKNTLQTNCIVYALQFQDDKLASGGKDRKVHIWDVETGQHTLTLKGHKGWISCLQMGHNQVVSGGGDGTVRMFDMRSGTNVRTIKVDTSIFSVGWVTCLQWDENKVITGAADKTIKITDIVSGKCINTLKGHQDAITSIQYDDSKLLSASLDRTVRLWNFSDRQDEYDSVLDSASPMSYLGSSCTVA